MPKKLLVVFGATGSQGGSVVKQVLADLALSQQFDVRAVTRDTTKSSAQALVRQGAEVVQANLDDVASTAAACTGAHTVFGMTVSDDHSPLENEFKQGKNIADAAVSAGAKWFIFSTMPLTTKISGGKYTAVKHFDIKTKVEEYARALPIRTAFFSPGTFMSNFATGLKPRPSPTGDGTYLISGPQNPETKFPLINTEGDTGKWISAILANPEEFEGKILCGATRLVTQTEVAEIFSEVTGKTVRYAQVPADTFASHFPLKERAQEVVEMMLYFQDFGYWGPETEKLVEWSAKQARGSLTTFKEYISTFNPIALD